MSLKRIFSNLPLGSKRETHFHFDGDGYLHHMGTEEKKKMREKRGQQENDKEKYTVERGKGQQCEKRPHSPRGPLRLFMLQQMDPFML